MSEEESKTGPIKRTIGLRSVLVCGLSLFLIAGGIGNLPRNFPGGLLILLGGLIIFPPFNKLLENKLNIALTSSLKILGVIVLVGVGGTIVGQSIDDEIYRPVSTQSPQPTSKPSSDLIDNNNITMVSKKELEEMIRKKFNASSDEDTGLESKNEYDLGEFYVVAHPPENEKYLDYIPRSKGGIEYVLKSSLYFFNVILALPIEDGVPVNLAECGTANAFYSPKDKLIVFCYELVELFDDMAIAKWGYSFLGTGEGKDRVVYYQPGALVWDNVEFVLYHEVAHALIDIYGLPVTGREEDAADQLATIIMVEPYKLGFYLPTPGRLLFVAEQWKMQTQIRKMQGYDPDYWDVHAIDEQRYANIVCWTYGSDPEQFQYLVEDGVLPVSRARSCPSEFEQMSSSWKRILEPYFTGKLPTIEGYREALGLPP